MGTILETRAVFTVPAHSQSNTNRRCVRSDLREAFFLICHSLGRCRLTSRLGERAVRTICIHYGYQVVCDSGEREMCSVWKGEARLQPWTMGWGERMNSHLKYIKPKILNDLPRLVSDILQSNIWNINKSLAVRNEQDRLLRPHFPLSVKTTLFLFWRYKNTFLPTLSTHRSAVAVHVPPPDQDNSRKKYWFRSWDVNRTLIFYAGSVSVCLGSVSVLH